MMGLFGGLRKARTRTVAQILMEIELYVGSQVCAVVNVIGEHSHPELKRPRQVVPNSRENGEGNLALVTELIRRDRTTGMKNWPFVDLSSDDDRLLETLEHATQRARQFSGSEKGMTEEGVAMVRRHFTELERVGRDISLARQQHRQGETEAALTLLVATGQRLEDSVDQCAQIAGLG